MRRALAYLGRIACGFFQGLDPTWTETLSAHFLLCGLSGFRSLERCDIRGGIVKESTIGR